MSNSKYKTVEDMTPEQQIERLIRQRNALWKLIDKFSMAHGDEKDGLRPEDRSFSGFDVEEDADELIIRVRNPLNTVRELRSAAGALWDKCAEIVGDAYAVEGVHPRTGEVDDDDNRDTGLYGRVASETGPW